MDAELNEEFKRIVAEMKPHAKKLPQKSSEERYRNNFLNIAHLIISVTFVRSWTSQSYVVDKETPWGEIWKVSGLNLYSFTS